jgi:hypothetical protein
MTFKIQNDKGARIATEEEIGATQEAVRQIMSGKVAGFLSYGRVKEDMSVEGDSFAQEIQSDAYAQIALGMMKHLGMGPEDVILNMAIVYGNK